MRTISCKSRGGFTLVEILIVIVILMIAAAIVIPSIGSAADSQAISAARILMADLEMTRSQAVTTQQTHSLVFSADRQSYKVVANYLGGAYGTAVAIPHPVVAGKLMEKHVASQNGMGSVSVDTVSFGGQPYVTFNSQGEPSANGTVTLHAGETHMAITVAPLTGAVTATRTSG